jgi:hypothetical protein
MIYRLWLKTKKWYFRPTAIHKLAKVHVNFVNFNCTHVETVSKR